MHHHSFADIFYSNCFNNGMLPLVLKRSEVEVRSCKLLRTIQ